MAKSKVKEVVEKVAAAVAGEAAEPEISQEQLDAERDPFAEVRKAKDAIAADGKVEGKKAKADRPGVSRKKVKVQIPGGVHLNINNVPYGPGVHFFEEHQIPSIVEMIDKKQRADLAVFVGKKYMVDRLQSDRSLVITEEKE